MKKYMNILMAITSVAAFMSCSPEFSNGTSDIDSWPDVGETHVYTHPCMLHTADDITRVKAKVESNAQPWKIGYDALVEDVNINYTPNAKETVNRANGDDPSTDAEMAYRLALMWRLTDDTKYADAAINILNAWARTNKTIKSSAGDEVISAGYSGYKYANAAELVRGYEGWTTEDFDAFKAWMTDVVNPVCYEYLARHKGEDPKGAWLSWDVPAMASVLSIGILCDDDEKVNFVIKYFKEGAGSGCIENAVVAMHTDPAGHIQGAHLAQSMETSREMGHAMTTVTAYGYVCQMAYNIGEDLFAYNENRVLDICEYLAKYNVDPTDATIDMPFTPYDTVKEGWKSSIGQNDVSQRGQICWGYELIYNHYKKLKNANPYYSREYARTMRPEGHGIDYGTLMYTLDPVEAGEDIKAVPERK